jgi:hypothetical protein
MSSHSCSTHVPLLAYNTMYAEASVTANRNGCNENFQRTWNKADIAINTNCIYMVSICL